MHIEVFAETDSEDASGWTYGLFHCPYVDLDGATLYVYSLYCVGGFTNAYELIGHMQEHHRDVDHDRHTPTDVDHDTGAPVDVDHDTES